MESMVASARSGGDVVVNRGKPDDLDAEPAALRLHRLQLLAAEAPKRWRERNLDAARDAERVRSLRRYRENREAILEQARRQIANDARWSHLSVSVSTWSIPVGGRAGGAIEIGRPFDLCKRDRAIAGVLLRDRHALGLEDGRGPLDPVAQPTRRVRPGFGLPDGLAKPLGEQRQQFRRRTGPGAPVLSRQPFLRRP